MEWHISKLPCLIALGFLIDFYFYYRFVNGLSVLFVESIGRTYAYPCQEYRHNCLNRKLKKKKQKQLKKN